MNRLKDFFNAAQLRRVAVVFLAGVLLLVGTACGNRVPRVSADNTYSSQTSSNATYPEGMSDIAPGVDTSAADAKAKRLINSAERNLNRTDSPGDVVDSYRSGKPLNERIEDLSKDVGESAKNTAQGVKAGTERGVRNLKQNTRNAAEDVSDTAQRTTDNAGDRLQNTARDAVKSTQRAAQDTANRVSNNT